MSIRQKKTTKNEDLMQGRSTIGGRYTVLKKLDRGAFGTVCIAMDTKDKCSVAVKIEQANCVRPALMNEVRVYQRLESSDSKGFPKLLFQKFEYASNLIVITLLGPNIETLFNYCGRKFTTKTICMLAEQMFRRVEAFHSAGLIHRDLKPENMLMGTKNKTHRLYLCDFGLSKSYLSHNEHIPFKDGKALVGTLRYCSTWTHNGLEQARRDDLESILWVLLYFVKSGRLTWMNLGSDAELQIWERKSAPSEVLYRSVNPVFKKFHTHVRSLNFSDKPDYAFLRSIFKQAMEADGAVCDWVFDWNTRFKRKKLLTIGSSSMSTNVGSPVENSMETRGRAG